MRRCVVVPVAGVGLLLVAYLGVSAQDTAQSQKDPPKQLQGSVKRVDQTNSGSTYLTITTKEMQPTNKEDVLQEVEKDHRFQLDATTKILGLDGKPDRQGLKTLEEGSWVRVEFKNQVALEVKKLPPR